MPDYKLINITTLSHIRQVPDYELIDTTFFPHQANTYVIVFINIIAFTRYGNP